VSYSISLPFWLSYHSCIRSGRSKQSHQSRKSSLHSTLMWKWLFLHRITKESGWSRMSPLRSTRMQNRELFYRFTLLSFLWIIYPIRTRKGKPSIKKVNPVLDSDSESWVTLLVYRFAFLTDHVYDQVW
jgi:hypothetical protein